MDIEKEIAWITVDEMIPVTVAFEFTHARIISNVNMFIADTQEDLTQKECNTVWEVLWNAGTIDAWMDERLAEEPKPCRDTPVLPGLRRAGADE